MNPADSLEKLVESLRGKDKYDSSKFTHTRYYFQKLYPNITESEFRLIISKGVYPHEYMDSFKRFNKEKLPNIECFYSGLNDDSTSKELYEHAQKVWNTFNTSRHWGNIMIFI